MTRGKYAIAAALLAAAGTAAWWLASRGDGGVAATRASNEVGAWHFEDGRWVRVSPGEVASLMREQSSRAPGAVRVSGTVRDDRGEPRTGAAVIFAGPGEEQRAVTSADGAYSIDLPPGFYRVYARADGYVAVGAVGTPRVPTNPEAAHAGVPQGDLAPSLGLFRDFAGVDVEMRASAIISGRLVDRRGQPVSGAVLRAVPYSASAVRPIDGTDVDVSNPDGSFKLVVPAGAHQLEASHPDFAGLAADADRHVVADRGSEQRVELTMADGCIVTGRVVGAGGDVVGAGQIEVDDGSSPPNNFVPVGALGPGGSFRVARSEEGSFRLRAWPYKSPPSEVRELDCADGARIDNLTLQLTEAVPRIEGRLVDHTGQPVKGGFVDLFPATAGGMEQQERTDDGGEFAFYMVPDGGYRLFAYVEGRGAAFRQLTVPHPTGVDLQLSGTGALTGTVDGITHGVFTLVVERCRLRGGAGDGPEYIGVPPRAFLVPVHDSHFQLSELPACALQARIETGYRTAHLIADITRDEAATVTLDLRRPLEKQLRGRVVDRTDRGISGVAIIREPSSGTPRAPTDFALTRADGSFVLEVYSGDRVHVSAPDGRETRLTIDWDDDQVERATAILD